MALLVRRGDSRTEVVVVCSKDSLDAGVSWRTVLTHHASDCDQLVCDCQHQ